MKKKKPTPKAPVLKGSPMAMVKAQQEADAAYNAAMEEYNAQVAEAEEALSAWSGIYALMNGRKRAARERQEAEQRERDKQLHDEAVAQLAEQKRTAAEKAKEQETIGTHAVNPKIKEKWDGAAKVEGNANALTLADGSTLRGHYVLTEAGAASASHDINNAFEPTEGFPIDENGESVNDRDYKRDTDAQQIVRDIARNYDSRALQPPVIVSKDGIVLSGNNRTMSGDMAAQQGTDKAYIDHLREFGQMYGFTPEQIDGMKHPRVVFVPDEQLPYDATTFARFNAEQQKKQSKPEHAVKLGKIVPDNVFTSITNDISRFDRLSDYYADDKAVSSAISQLLGAGVINEMQLPEMRTGNSLSAAGKELIENTLIGKVFQTSPDAVRHIISTPTLRQSVIMGLNEIAHNRTLAKSGYDLSNELGAAVDLVARAKSAHPDIFKDGMPVSPFGREQGLFDDEYGDSRVTDGLTLMLADILNSGKPSELRKFLSVYNNEAASPAGGQLDMFSGKVTSKEELLNRVTEYFRNATPREQQAIVDAAVGERKQRAEAAAQVADGTKRDGGSTNQQGVGGVQEETRNDVANEPMSHDEAIAFIAAMENRAEVAPSVDLSIENWDALFGKDGIVNTPIGEVKMGDNQFTKMMREDRHGKLGMVKPTLENPDVILEDASKAKEGDTEERPSSYIFVKAFKKADGSRYYYFTSITVSKDGLEVVVSNQEKRKNAIANLLSKDRLVWKHADDVSDASDVAQGLYSSQGNVSDLAIEGTDAPQTSMSNSIWSASDGKDINKQTTLQENGGESSENKGETPLSEQIATASADVKTNSTEARQKAKDGKPRLQKMDDSSVMDAEYFAAIERGDMEEAQRIVDEAAERAGYSVGSDYQGTSAFNGAAPYGNGYFLTKEERKEAWDNGDFEGESTLGDYIGNGVDGGNLEELTNNSSYRHADDMRKEAIENVRDAIENGRNTITMYRSVPSSVQEGKFRNGDWITPSRKYAEDNAEIHGWGKDYRIIEQKVSVDDVWFDGNDIAEWGYGREKDYVNDTDFAYKNTENNRKLLDVVTRDDEGNIISPSKRFNSDKADERYQKGNSKKPLTEVEKTLRDAVTDRLRESGIEVIDNDTEGQRVLDEANGGDAQVRLQAKLSALSNAANIICGWLTDNKRGKSFTIELPETTRRMVFRAMGRDFDSHSITANGVAHAQKNHGINGQKLNGKSIPLTKADMELIPYIMTAPDYVRRGSSDVSGRVSVRFYKELSNGYVVVAEKEYKNSPNDMETITMWAELSDKATNAQQGAAPDTHVQNAILDIDVAKIRKDAEDTIAKDRNLREHRVYHGSGADFDHFDHSHMGEGEGSQAYGWGTYVTEVEGIGRTYAEQGRKDVPEFVYDGKEMDFSRLAAELSDMAGENNDGILTHFLWEWNRNGGHRAKEYLAYEIREAKYRRNHSSNPTAYDEEIAGLEALLKVKGIRKNTKTNKTNLYTIEIPEDNGKNYLDWNKPLPDGFDKEAVKERIMDDKRTEDELENGMMERDLSDGMDYAATGKDLYKAISLYMGDKAASEMLHDIGYAGIKYPADNMRGGRGDGAKNYVIFNEKDLKIIDHVRFFRTADGEADGFTVGGRIYIDPRIATSETPVHEYAHLWATALRNGNPKEWRNVVGLMKGTPVWDEVKKRYPELETDDEIADEVIAAYSGRRGAERLREEAKETADGGGGVFDKAKAVGALLRVRAALGKFWRAVADFLHIHYTSAEEVADRVMKDLLDGIDPRKMGKGEDGVRFSAKQKRALETATWQQHDVEANQATVVSSAAGAKIVKNLDTLANTLEEKTSNRSKTFMGDVARALGASEKGSSSQYATFETVNGSVVTIRLANHNASSARFDNAGRDNAISIVITNRNNEGVSNDGNAHIVEFYYNKGKLTRADGKPLAEIVRSIKQALYSGEFKDTTGLAERQEVNGADVVRYQFIGEKGAGRADHAEEVTTRLDNLSVAREMEVAKKDAKAIKMATGWERGADGKWRYEIPDCKVSSTMDIGGKVVKRNEEDMLWTSGKLGDVVDAPELLAAYPELEQVRLETDEIMDDMPSNGEYNPRTNTITIHADELKYLNSILNHEIQHAIQHLEGFARGGNPADIDRGKANIREVFDKISNGLDDAAKLRGIPTENEWLQSLDGDAVKVMEKQLKAYQGKNFALTRVYVDNVGFDNHDKELLHAKLDQANDIIEKQRKELGGTEYIGNSFEAYRRLGGEVESRNVEKRMGMAAEERRASLAAETEDVSREDQIFLMDEGEGDSYSLREADGEENAEVKYRTSGELDEEYGDRWKDEQTNDDGRHTTQVKNTLSSYRKFGDWVKRDSGGRKVEVLDASSGLGIGTEWMRANGINAEDVEPYPSENRTAPTYRSYGDIDKKYDYIISNAVLNVIPDDWRADVLHKMADKLRVGGKLVINVRGAESIRKQGKEGETRITLDDPSEILVLRPNGSIKAYQKGFTKAELKEWCETELGEGYSVETANERNAGSPDKPGGLSI